MKKIGISILILFALSVTNSLADDNCDHSMFENKSGTPEAVDKLVGCIKAAKDRRDELVHLQHALRKEGYLLCNSLATYKKLRDDPSIKNDETKRASNENEIKKYEDAIEKVRRTISFSGCRALFQTFDDYDQFLAIFSAGYEYTSVNNIFKQGFPLIGLMVYIKHWESKSLDSDSGFGFYGIHNSFNARLTGATEQQTDFKSSSPTIKNLGDKRSLDFEMPIFLPMYRSDKLNHGRLWEYIGPIAVIGGTKVDDEDNKKAVLRRYAGLRAAINPELYTDIMYGFTEGIGSQRLEVKGQLPVSWFLKDPVKNKDTRLFLGAIGNFGLERREGEADVIKVYLSWNIDFIDIFTDSSEK